MSAQANWTRRPAIVVFTALAVHISLAAHAQVLLSEGMIYRQNFDALAGSAAPGATVDWTNNATLPGWHAGSEFRGEFTSYRVCSGETNNGWLYSFGGKGAHPVTDRALGSIASAAPGAIAFGVRFRNDTAETITNAVISYTGEQWRNATPNASAQTLAFSYKTAATPITDPEAGVSDGWIPVRALDFIRLHYGRPATALDGNAPENRKQFSNVPLAGLALKPGEELFLRWHDIDDPGQNDHALAIDDLRVSFNVAPGAIEAPATPWIIVDNDANRAITLAAGEKAWAQVPEILARIVPPTFPNRDFAITDFGAVGDGKTDCTEAFRTAIEACHRGGGGRVVVPEGIYLTGAIHLQSNVNLHLVKNATIRFSTEPEAFLPVVFARFESTEVMNYSPFIYAFEQENIAITGEGTLDGQGSKGPWHEWKQSGREDERRLVAMGDAGVPVEERVFGEHGRLRPNFVQLLRSRNILIEGIRLIDSPMWVLNPVYCTNVTIRGVTVDTKSPGPKAPNTDGCNPESSTDVLIENSVFNTDDDCIAVKAGRDVDGRRVGIPSRNIIIRNCHFKAGHGGVTAGSETAAGIRNIFIENCTFDSPDLRMAIRFKTNPRRGGFIEHFYVRNSTVKTAVAGIHATTRYERVDEGDARPYVRHIEIRNVTFENTQQPIFIEGLPDTKITGVTIADCVFKQVGQPSAILNAERIHLLNTVGTGLD
jgi:hypothetical protein